MDETGSDADQVAYAEHVFGDPLPDPLPVAGSYPGQRFNYFLRGIE